MNSDNGILISFDGPPRSGRTYQADALAAALAVDGHDVVRVSLPDDDVPLAKTSRSWMEDRLAVYARTIETDAVPVLERGGVVILDGGVTSILLRARAVMGQTAPLGMLYAHDVRAMRAAAVDLEWIFLDTREGQRPPPGFECASLWKSAACAHAAGSSFPDATSCGARRHATYVLRSMHADAASVRFGTIAQHLRSERLMPEWATAVAETREQRDDAIIARRMEQWTRDQRMPLYGIIAEWHAFTEAQRTRIAQAIPARQGAVAEFVGVLRGARIESVSDDVNAVLKEKDDAEIAEAARVALDATDAPTEAVT